jgi:hypothetical protein
MRLTNSVDIDAQAEGLCPPGRGPDARIISPLPNLRLEPGAAVAEIVHHPLLEPINGSSLAGSATLRLRAEELQVRITAGRRVHIDLRRCNGRSGDLLLVVTACGAARPDSVSSARFDLSMRGGFAELGSDELAEPSGVQAGLLGHAALGGLSTRGWLAGPSKASEGVAPTAPTGSDRIYFLRRIKDEIGAALRAQEPSIASRHVQLATLLAGRLQDNAPLRPVSEAHALYFSCFASERLRLP